MSFLKPFQAKMYKELRSLLAKNNTAMLAAATGSGKTEMMCQFIADNPKLRILILAHGQKSLRTNFSDRLAKYDIDAYEMGHSSKKDVEHANKSMVVVALPQNIHQKLKAIKKFDVVIVDEAHEFYMPKDKSVMYPKIKSWHKGRWILLSASHYRIDAKKVFFSRENALAVGQIADATVKLIEETTKIDDNDITRDGFLKEAVNVPTSVQVVAKVLRGKGRTPAIIAKHSVAAARELANDLGKVYKGKICVSDNASDPLGEKLDAFKAGKYDVCIVVYRGNLGFDFPGMATFIDGSYTTNIPRMEQMLGRVVRLGGDQDDKKFIKLVPANAWTRGILLGTAVLALTKDEMYREWKGDEAKLKLPGKPAEIVDDLNGRTKDESFEEDEKDDGTPVNGPTELMDGTKDGTRGSAVAGAEEVVGTTERTQTAEPANMAGVTISTAGIGKPIDDKEPKMKTRKTLELSFGHLVGMFKGKDSCTLRQAINYAGVGNGIDTERKKEEILKFAKKNGHRPSLRKPEENGLARVLYNYTSPSSDCYDPTFAEKLNELAPIVDTASLNKKNILVFAKKHKRRPSRSKPEEKKLGIACQSYTQPTHRSYDPVFAEKLNELVPIVDTASLDKKAILAFAKKHRRRPSQTKTDEKKMARSCYLLTKPSQACYDPTFVKNLNEWAPIIDTVTPKKEAILAFTKKHGKRPSKRNPEEKKLGIACQSYTQPSHRSYDPAFKAELDAILKPKK